MGGCTDEQIGKGGYRHMGSCVADQMSSSLEEVNAAGVDNGKPTRFKIHVVIREPVIQGASGYSPWVVLKEYQR